MSHPNAWKGSSQLRSTAYQDVQGGGSTAHGRQYQCKL